MTSPSVIMNKRLSREEGEGREGGRGGHIINSSQANIFRIRLLKCEESEHSPLRRRLTPSHQAPSNVHSRRRAVALVVVNARCVALAPDGTELKKPKRENFFRETGGA